MVLLLLIQCLLLLQCFCVIYVWSVFCCTVLRVVSCFAIILLEKRELVTLPCLEIVSNLYNVPCADL